ncbi:MAG TPA: SDR family NAD(P)-dependent oxidoreductase, partial [Mycobacterium sp.]|nr:SDR family NAD(P)-dependent oxidoreductase [Mycobacterium sp.]
MTTRTAIITGASTGLGRECARALLASDPSWHVVLAVRDTARGADAVVRLGHPDRCTVIEMDLASLRSVRGFIDSVRGASLPPLHAIVCNAGVQVVSGTEQTTDGVEMTFGVNHLGHFALVQGLIEDLARPARIVVVSSGTHDPTKHTGMPSPHYSSAADLAQPRHNGSADDGRRRYTTSKLCNVLFAYELDRRLGHGAQGVTVTAFDPGLMPGSGLARDYPPMQRLAWRYLLPALRVLPGINSTRTSGRNLAALVSDARFDGVTGKYFSGRKQIPS